MRYEKGKVTTICYGEIRHWDDRKEAMDFFEGGFGCSDGCEALRYARVFFDLYDGFSVAWDGEEGEIPDMDGELFDRFIECHPWLKDDE